MTDRCLDRLRDENSLIWPMMVSAMFRALSKALSCKDMGSDFIFLRTRVNSVRPRRNEGFKARVATYIERTQFRREAPWTRSVRTARVGPRTRTVNYCSRAKRE